MLKSIRANYSRLGQFQKSGSGTPAYTRYINRFLGRVLTAFISVINISPNAISVISGFITYSAYILFLVIELNIMNVIFLVIALIFGYALDSVDGQLARLKDKRSKFGEWLDHTLDAIKIPLGHATAIFLIVSSLDIHTYTLIYFIIILSISCGVFLSGILKSKLVIKNSSTGSENKASVIKSIFMLPIDYGTFMFLFLFAYDVSTFFLVYLIWSPFYLLFSMMILYKSGKQLNVIT